MNDYPIPHLDLDLSGKTALVTGASAGLGSRFARVLAKCGAQVALAARRTDRLQALAADIQNEGGKCAQFPLDMTERSSIRSMLASLEDEMGMVDILVNNAGIVDAQYAVKMSDELVDAVFDTNLIGPWVLSCEIAKRLIAEKRPGRMVNISSMGGFNYNGIGAALYSVTKSAIARMTEVLAVEWARFGINVNAIAPGAFNSEMMDGMVSRMGDLAKNFPRGKICDPALLDSTLLYLVSPASEAVTGTVVKVDDGQGSR